MNVTQEFKMEFKDLERLTLSLVTLLLLGLSSVVKATTDSNSSSNSTEGAVTATIATATEDTRFVKLSHTRSTTKSITVDWTVPENSGVEGFRVETVKIGSQAKQISPILEWNATEYVIEDLSRNTDYQVCVHALLAPTSNTTEQSCLDLYTIPFIRWDSLIALFIVLGIVLLLVVLGLLCWRHARNKQRRKHNEDPDNNKIKSESTQPILLAPPVDDRPRSSIEDADIPYITPPIDELENDEREYALKATHRKRSKD